VEFVLSKINHSMTIDELIAQKPHLADLFRFYERTPAFNSVVRELLSKEQAFPAGDMRSYPRSVIDPVFRHFAVLTEVPQDMLAPLKRAMEVGDIDFTRLPFSEVPAFSLPYPEDDLAMLLFLLSRPYFSLLREARPREGQAWVQGRCPVCSGQPALLSRGPHGTALIHCSYCETTGPAASGGCPVCLNDDDRKRKRLTFGNEQGLTITTCDHCRSYVKTFDAAMHRGVTPDAADLMSLPLDLVVQEKGYLRRAPNPLGMLRMSLAG
jgi:FdhE protein